jgi:hypothetical protein
MEGLPFIEKLHHVRRTSLMAMVVVTTRRAGISDEVSAERRQESSVVSDSQIPSMRSQLYTDDFTIHQSRFKIHFDVRGSFFFARESVRLALSFLWKMFFVFRKKPGHVGLAFCVGCYSCSFESRCSFAISSWRARKMRLRTVPIGISMICAMSSYDKPSISLSTSGCRNSSANSFNASCSI